MIYPVKLNIATVFLVLLAMTLLFSCNDKPSDQQPEPGKFIVKAADLSFLPELEDAGVAFYNLEGNKEDMLKTLKNAGMNTVRIRLWKDPVTARSGFAEVKSFAEKVKANRLKVWLTVHYSDTWADPSHQTPPAVWESIGFDAVKDSLYEYTKKIVNEIRPDYIQIGNEINKGMIWPRGYITHPAEFKELLKAGALAVRENLPECKIMLHYAGFSDAEQFYSVLQDVDYDIIGLSYYPMWHGKDLNQLETTIDSLGKKFNKQVIIAETSYPFTLAWNDWTNNVVGLEEQLIDGFPATPEGQLNYLNEIHRISVAAENSVGFAYWGGEWVAYKGHQATNGSSYENQAFYDFEFKALPVIGAFKN